MFKKFFLCLTFMACMLVQKSQAQMAYFNGDILNYALNATPVNGIKIRTNLPFTSGTQMPTIIMEGYNFGQGKTIGVVLTYYIYNDLFTGFSASSFGGAAPRIFLANENGKVVIFLDTRDYYSRFNIRGYASGQMSAETTANFTTGWSAVDQAITGTKVVEVLYQNSFPGRVGIGGISPVAPLHISTTVTQPNGELAAAILGSAYNHWTYFGSPTGGKIRGSNEGYLAIETNNAGSDNKLYINTTSNGNIIMATSNAKVAIGTGNPGEYKLAVNGSIGAKKVKVTLAGWPDFVFEPDYKMMTLAEIESFIKTNKHLPEIPSAAEVEKGGLDLGEMNKKLLQKIEELTLHLIEEHKQVEELKEEVKELKARMKP